MTLLLLKYIACYYKYDNISKKHSFTADCFSGLVEVK